MKKLWTEAYRPKHVADVIFQDDRQRSSFLRYVENGEIPNLLLSGAQGTGKTTTSRALIRDLKVDRIDVMRINASDENSVDDMREKIRNFAYTMPLGKFKVIQLEEADHLSFAAQAVLRTIIEDASDNARFVFTCNYVNKIIPALLSRLTQYEFKAPCFDDVLLRAGEILIAEDVEFDEETLTKFVTVGYPDVRKVVSLLEEHSSNGRLNPPDGKRTDADWKFALIDLMEKGDLRTARKMVCENASREEVGDVYRFLYDNAHTIPKFKTQEKQEEAIVVIAEHLRDHSLVADVEINLAACMVRLMLL